MTTTTTTIEETTMKPKIVYSEEAISETAKLIIQLNTAKPYKTVEECETSIRYYMLKILADEEATLMGTAGWVISKSTNGNNTYLDFYIDPHVLRIS